MVSESIHFGMYKVKLYSLNTLIIGSGAASLNAAVSLHSRGQKDILIATTRCGAGTSNNAGSDKQTYYKLSLCGDEPDSVRAMAEDLFNGKCMHGDIALCEAQGSVQAFMKLVSMGVPFPHDKYGSWAGYKTDHDPRARATSAGPYTSKLMVSVLSAELKRRKIKVLDNHQIIELLTDSDKTRVTGAIAINLQKKDPLKAFVLFNATNIILGTGGPGDLYAESVYPLSQTGSIGMAFRAGAGGQNLTESQFGIASLKFRWNLSGSYQQAVPRYYSTDAGGNDEKEFLNEYYPDYTTLTKAIFLKGYQWPFNPSRISGSGSSLIDLLVFKEREEKGRRVFIDYRRNPSWRGKDIFLTDKPDSELYGYFINSGALQPLPVDRLISMNSPAFELYMENGIDLLSEPVEIGICAQHNNGGLKGNIWWESDLRHLFPVGEVNGSHGVYRPGGSALNSGQAGSARAAEFIHRRYNEPPPAMERFIAASEEEISSVLKLSDHWLLSDQGSKNDQVNSEICQRMSAAGSIIRNRKKVSRAVTEAFSLFENIREKTGASSVEQLADCFRIRDNCLAHLMYLEAIRYYIEKRGRSRGSFIVTGNDESLTPDASVANLDIYLCRYNRDVEKKIIEIYFREDKITIDGCEVRGIPSQNLWFETVWKEYREDNYIEG